MDREERLKRQKEFLVSVAFWGVWGMILWIVLKAAGSVLLPFVAAFAVAYLLSGVVDFFSEKLHLRRKITAVVSVIFFYVILAVLLYFAGSRIVRLLYDILQDLGVFFADTLIPVMQRFYHWLEKILAVFYPMDIAGNASHLQSVGEESVASLEKAGKLMSGISDGLLAGVSDIAAEIPGFFMQLLIAVIATVFMELEFCDIKAFLKRQIPKNYQKVFLDGKKYVTGTLGKCILSYCLIFILTFAELTIGLFLLKIKHAYEIAFIIAILDILPVLGTGTVLIPWSVLAIASGKLGAGIGILLLYLIITFVRNLVEPKLIGKQMGLSPVLMLPCMLIGLKLFGVIGLFAVPFFVSLLKQLNDRGVIRIFH